VPKGDVNSFISVSHKLDFSPRILAHTAVIGPTTEKSLEAQDPPMRVLDPHQMDRAYIQWAAFQVEYPDRMVQKDGKKTRFPYQRLAIADVAEALMNVLTVRLKSRSAAAFRNRRAGCGWSVLWTICTCCALRSEDARQATS
jgi:predicted helicase